MRGFGSVLALPFLAVTLSGCEAEVQDERALEPGPPVEVPVSRSAAPSQDPRDPLVVFLGDSLTAGFGLSQEEAFPALIQEMLEERGLRVRMVNAGVSGDTTAGGLRRLPWLLQQRPDLLVIELGANDGLRGLSLEMTERNLREMVLQAREAGARVLLVGMKIPPNYGPDYARGFEALFPRLAAELKVSLVPFLLEGVAANPELNLADGIHPNAQGHARVAANLLPHLEELLQDPKRPDHRPEADGAPVSAVEPVSVPAATRGHLP